MFGERRRMAALLLAAILALIAAPAQPREWTEVRIGTEGAYFPFNYVDAAGELAGFDIDIAKALCRAMAVECAFVAMNWQHLIPGLLAHEIDAVAASLSITDERRTLVDFTDKYYQTPARFVARKGSGLTVSREGLAGKVLGAQRATVHADYLLDHYRDVATVRVYDTQEDVHLDLYSGRLDAALGDGLAWLGWLERAGRDFEFAGEPLTDPRWFGEGIGIALRKEDADLKERFNRALAQILADGTYRQINAKYFPFSVY